LAYEVEPGIKHQELYYSSSKCAGKGVEVEGKFLKE